MTTYALVHFPDIEKTKINELRDEHDPYKDLTDVPLDDARYEKALRQTEAANLDFETQVDRLTLVEFDDQFTKSSVVKEFSL